jgi:outer membrane protein assembly factor BamD
MARVFAVLLAVFVGACAARIPLVDRLEADELYTHAMERFESRRWDNAVEAFERFVFRFPGDPRHQDARYRLAEAYFNKREFLTAGVEYTRFAGDFPNSQLADDARFGACRAYAELSPRPPLDQQYTEAAIEHCRTMVDYYPESEFAPRAREIVSQMTDRLAIKHFEMAEHYFRRRAYDSALMGYSDVLAFFPGTPTAPRALLRMVEVYDRLGYEQEQEETRQRLLREYPASVEARLVQQRAVAGRP